MDRVRRSIALWLFHADNVATAKSRLLSSMAGTKLSSQPRAFSLFRLYIFRSGFVKAGFAGDDAPIAVFRESMIPTRSSKPADTAISKHHWPPQKSSSDGWRG